MEPVILIDCEYQGPRHAASYLLISHGKAAFIENNTQFAVPFLLDALHREGLTPEDVEYIVITHVHLDHAGGTAALTAACPNAIVLAHPRAVPHLINPAALVAGATAVYGQEQFSRFYGEIQPVAGERVRAVEDDERVVLEARTLHFLHTSGHANHHLCIHDSASGGVFTGDMFGIGFDPIRKSVRPFLHFSSAPVHFDPEAARASIARILALNPQHLYLTHFGVIDDIVGASDVLLESLEGLAEIFDQAVQTDLFGEALVAWCRHRVNKAVNVLVESCGVSLSEAELYELNLSLDVDAQGIAWVAEKRRNRALPQKQNVK